MKFRSKIQIFHACTATVIIVIASIVTMGWMLGKQSWISFGMIESVMRFNTALVLMMIGGAFGGLAMQQKRITLAFSGIAFLFSLATVLEYVFNIDFGIDSLIFKSQFTQKPFVGDRMAINTAISFGLVTFVLFEIGRSRKLHFLATLCSSSVFAIACIDVIGHVIGINTAPGLGGYYGMAIPTALCLILVSGNLIYVLILDQRKISVRALLVPIAAGNVVLVCTIALWHSLLALENNQTKEAFEANFVSMKTELESEFRHHEYALDRLAHRCSNMTHRDEKNLRRDFLNYLRDLPGLSVLALYDSVSANWFIESKADSKQDLNQLVESLEFPFVKGSSSTQPRLPAQIVNGKKSDDRTITETWICIPVVRGEIMAAILVAKFNIQPFIQDRLGSTLAKNQLIVIRDDYDTIFANAQFSELRERPLVENTELRIGNAKWKFVMGPNDRWIDSHRSNIASVALMTGFAFTVLVTITARLAIMNIRNKQNEIRLARSELLTETQGRQLAEQQVLFGERQASNIFQQSPIGKFLYTKDGKIVRVNPQFCKIVGYAEADLLNMSIDDITVHEDRARHRQAIADMLNQHISTYKTEKGLLGARDSQVQVFFCSTYLNNDNQSESLFLGQAIDLTLVKQAEERARHIIEAAPCGMLMINHDGEIVMVNSLVEKMFGFARSELIGQPVEMLVPNEFRVSHPEQRNEFFAQPRPRTMGAGREVFGQRKDGSKFPVELGLNPIMNKEGIFVLSSIVDISARKAAELAQAEAYAELQHVSERLHDSTERFELAIRANADGIWDWNVLNNSVFYSPRYRELLGCNEEELEGTFEATRSRTHADDLERVYKAVAEHLNDRVPFDVEYRIRHNSGEYRWHRARGQAVWNDAGQAVRMVGSSSDITDRKLAEQHAQQFSEELKRSNQDLEQFAYVASHDLQEPLRKVASCCQVLAEDYGDKLDEKGHEWIQYAVDGAKRMGVLIADLLAYSRIGTQKDGPDQLDSQEIYNEAIESLDGAIKDANAELICRPLPNVMANRTQLLHLLQNLIGNAIKYRGSDPLLVEIGAEPFRIEHAERDAQEMWQFYVKDNGIGIDPAYYEKIFVIFQRLHTREKYEGTGIGLAFCKKIVERMGGSIWVESKPGKGSTFFFTVPAVEKNLREFADSSKTEGSFEESNA